MLRAVVLLVSLPLRSPLLPLLWLCVRVRMLWLWRCGCGWWLYKAAAAGACGGRPAWCNVEPRPPRPPALSPPPPPSVVPAVMPFVPCF